MGEMAERKPEFNSVGDRLRRIGLCLLAPFRKKSKAMGKPPRSRKGAQIRAITIDPRSSGSNGTPCRKDGLSNGPCGGDIAEGGDSARAVIEAEKRLMVAAMEANRAVDRIYAAIEAAAKKDAK